MNNYFSENKAGLSIGFGIFCMAAGTLLSAVVSPKAMDAIEQRKEELDVDKLPMVEAIKTGGKYYLPVILTSAMGAGLILYGNKVNLDHRAADFAAYAMTNATLETTREKIKEVVGEKKAKDIEEAVAKERVEKNPPDNKVVIMTGDGDNLCYESLTRQYFRSSMNQIEKVINNINFDLRDHKVSINEYCLKLGLYETPIGKDLGWDIDLGGYLDVYYTAIIVKGEPCISINHRNEPHSI